MLDESPLVSAEQLALWDWISAYYMCTTGEVMRAALPSGLRPESESKVQYNYRYEDETVLDQHERLLLEVVKDQGELTIGDLQLADVAGDPLKVLKRLVEKGAVEINEFVRHGTARKSVALPQACRSFQERKGTPYLAGSTDPGTQAKRVCGTSACALRVPGKQNWKQH